MPQTLVSLNIAPALALVIDGREVMSGIGKRSVAGPVEVRALGLAGDGVGLRRGEVANHPKRRDRQSNQQRDIELNATQPPGNAGKAGY